MNNTGKGQFVKGQSGNKSGVAKDRPPGLSRNEVEANKSLAVVREIRDNDKINPEIRLRACVVDLSYTKGMPRQSVEITDKRKPGLLNIGLVPLLPAPILDSEESTTEH